MWLARTTRTQEMLLRPPRWPFAPRIGYPWQGYYMLACAALGGQFVDVLHQRGCAFNGAGGVSDGFEALADGDSVVLTASGLDSNGYLHVGPGYPSYFLAGVFVPDAAASGSFAGLICSRTSSVTAGIQVGGSGLNFVDMASYSTNPLPFTDQVRGLFAQQYTCYDVDSTRPVTRYLVQSGALTSAATSTGPPSYWNFSRVWYMEDPYGASRTLHGRGEWGALIIGDISADQMMLLESPEGISTLVEPYGRTAYFLPVSAGSGTTKSLADTGSGADSLASLAVGFALADTGSGSDSLASLAAALSLADSGAGADAISSVAASFAVTDTGAGADSLASVSATLALADSGSGADAIATSVLIALAESGAGADAIASVSASVSLADTGTGADAVGGVSVTVTLSDTASAADVLNVFDSVRKVAESASGADSVVIVKYGTWQLATTPSATGWTNESGTATTWTTGSTTPTTWN